MLTNSEQTFVETFCNYMSRRPQIYGDMEFGSVKSDFKINALKYLKLLGREMGLDKSTYKITFNPGGPGVGGDAYLHSDNIYIQVGAFNTDMGIMYRTCKNQTDYTGGFNQWATWGIARNFIDFVARIVEVERKSGLSNSV